MSISRVSIVFVLLVFQLNASAFAVPRVPKNIGQLMQDRKYDDAIKAIDAANKEDASQDYLAFLKARALHFQKKYDAAIAAFDEMLKAHPKSEWIRHARFAKAVSFARKGDFRSAELIYRAEADYLLSLDRKQEIANIYLEFADAFFKPESEDTKPDFQKALGFYQQALAVGPKPEERIKIELLIAQCYQKLGKSNEALKGFSKFIADHAAHDLAVEARFQLGEVQLAAGNLAAARRTWQDLLELNKESKSKRLAEAAFKISRTYNIPAPQNDDQLGLGVAALDSFIKKYPEHELASQAHLRIAQSYQNFGRYEDAVASLKRFLGDENYAQTKEVPEARYLLGVAMKLQGKFDEALATWSDYLVKHPTHKYWSDAQREIINVEYLKAHTAFTKKKYADARQLWTAFLAKYPLDARSRIILYRFGQMHYNDEKWDDAINDWRRLVSKYPNTNESSQAQYMIAQTLEEKLNKFEDAIKEYKKTKWGRFQNNAVQRIARLTAKRFTIETERIFRSNETPKIKLTSRNIEDVTVRVYHVDLETYFRKMHLARGVEQLDISLIDPDFTFEHKVAGYEKYKLCEADVEIALPDEKANKGSGVLAVTVTSKAFEATTMLLQSDLDVIVKSSRDEVFVFAENMRTGKAWPEARILVSNGKQVFAEGTTGADGVFHKSFEELKSCNDVRVFAIADGHTASNVIALRGLGVAQGLSPKGFIYTDRPAYRAGQMVHVRGIIRQVAGDTYKIEDGKKYDLEVFDNRNRLVHTSEVALNVFGSLHANFLLPSASPQGQYRIQVQDGDKQNYQGTFVVHQYQLQPVQLEADVERTVFYRGEEITGTIRASYYYGAPVIGREIRYQLAGGRSFTAKTSVAGEVKFRFATRDFRESQTLALTAALPEHNLQISKPFFLATQGFLLSAKTVRPTYLAGESFEVEVTAADAEGKPIERPLTLSVLHRQEIDGETGEVLIEKHDLKSDDKGLARQTLTLDEGGRYVLRFEGVDRFDNPISTQATVRISDDEDKVRLRILADTHTYKVGDVAKLQIHWREQPALALITYQGARILKYELVQLKKGTNNYQVSMGSKLAPNFDLAVSVMNDAPQKLEDDTQRRFHQTSSPFTVQRQLLLDLKIKPAADGKNAKPGQDIEVEITTTDPQGRPVSSEVSLAMVEKALLSRFNSPLSKVSDFFRGTRRQSAVRTTSSVSFKYRPPTQSVNAQLLAEQDRREIHEAESARLAEIRGVTLGTLVDSVELFDRDGDGPPQLGGAMLDDSGGAFEDIEAVVEEVPGEPQSALSALGAQVTNGEELGEAGQQLAGGEFPKWAGSVPGRYREEIRGYYRTLGGEGRPGNGRAANYTIDHFAGGSYEFIPNQTEWQILEKGGAWRNLNLKSTLGFNWNAEQAKTFVAEMQKKGNVLLPQLASHETAYWNPAVTTDEKGKTTLTITLPERSTAWSLLARGITTETLAGEAANELAVSKELFGQIKLPTAFTDGDQATIIATVHNNAIAKGKIEVTLELKIGDKKTIERKTIDVLKKGITDLSFSQKLALPESAKKSGAPATKAEFLLTIAAGEQQDVVRQSVPVVPYGMPVFAIAGGSSAGDVTAVLNPPKGMKIESPRLQIIVGPTVERSLLDVVLARATWCQAESNRFASGAESAVSNLMAALALQKLIAATREADNPHAQSLDARIRSSINLLVAQQNDDGGWSWAGGQSDKYHSARVVWGLSLARAAGFRVADSGYNNAVGFLRTQLSKSRVTDYETKAVLLHALATAGHDDFTLANQLYRNRPALSAAGLAHLSLAYSEMDRRQTAGELVSILGERLGADGAATPAKGLSWNQSSTELRALHAIALEKAATGNGELKKQVDWLMAHRTGHRWSPDKATGPAMLAACRWFAKTRFEGEKYKLAIVVNDLAAQELEIDADSRTQTIDISSEFLDPKKDEQRVRFEITGRGRYAYQCVLGGFVPAEELKSTTQDWKVVRTYEPASRELDGVQIPRGFDVLKGTFKKFRNELKQLPVARRGHVELQVTRQGITGDTSADELDYLVVTEPLPAGVAVIEKSVRGGFERFEIAPGAITFYIGSRRGIAPIHYDVHGYLPGEYRTTPTIVRNSYRPDRMAVSTVKPLSVLTIGAKSTDKYELSPRELYELGRRYFEKEDYRQAGDHLSKLMSSWSQNLNSKFFKSTAHMLLNVHLKNGPPAEVVRYFEIIIEKYPDLQIDFDKLLQVGRAYHDIGEYERSYLVFRATCEASFMRESRVAGFLQSQGELLRSVDTMTSLLREYPPESYTATARYALAQDVYANAPEAKSDPKLREKKITRIDLIRQALAMLDGFLTKNPEDPAADQASFSLANALLELEVYEETIAACERFAERFPKSDYLDSFWYIIGYCQFARGQHDDALSMCDKVAKAKRVDSASGREIESPNKWQAIYILGQIHHSLGKAENAITEYKRVRDRFPDARQAIEYFTRKQIELPEVTTLKPGEAGNVELKFRNIPHCDTTVYRMDLMKFSLLKRNLGEITSINLAGIRPHHQATTKLGDGKDFRDRTEKLKLPLKEEGAYLVVCRGGDLHTSGLVLVTPLVVEVQENSGSGRVRTTVRDVTNETFLTDVHVKVIGTLNSEFTSGDTDLRGVFVADKINGQTTVIAQAEGGRYAFFRGTTHLGPMPAQQQGQAAAQMDESEAAPNASGKGALLKNLQESNMKIQVEQQDQLQDLFDNDVESGIGGGFGGGIF